MRACPPRNPPAHGAGRARSRQGPGHLHHPRAFRASPACAVSASSWYPALCQRQEPLPSATARACRGTSSRPALVAVIRDIDAAPSLFPMPTIPSASSDLRRLRLVPRHRPRHRHSVARERLRGASSSFSRPTATRIVHSCAGFSPSSGASSAARATSPTTWPPPPCSPTSPATPLRQVFLAISAASATTSNRPSAVRSRLAAGLGHIQVLPTHPKPPLRIRQLLSIEMQTG